MKIETYKTLIKNLPVRQQSFTTKRIIWQNAENHIEWLKQMNGKLFVDNLTLTISRQDIFETQNLRELIVKTIYWGYPRGMRGNHFADILEHINLIEMSLKRLKQNKNRDKKDFEELAETFKGIKGLGLSTYSKLLYFSNLTFNKNPCLILDQRLINIFASNIYSDFQDINDIRYGNAANKYLKFLKIINKVAQNLETEEENIEQFLFLFGNNLKSKNITTYKVSNVWNGYCPESFINGKTVRMRLNQDDFFESEETGLQISSIPGVQAVILNFRGKGNFRATPKFGDEVENGEILSPQNTDSPPFNDRSFFFKKSEEIEKYISEIKAFDFHKKERTKKDKFIGCILGGAIGDALGAPIEFLSIESIHAKYGKEGIQSYVEHSNGKGEFTDDTQMLIFTAEGLLRAAHRAMLKGIDSAQTVITYYSYLRWLKTQGITIEKAISSPEFEEGWLMQRQELFKRRAPGNTCLSSLESGEMGTVEKPINDSKGCGTVMRIAPVGLVFTGRREVAFEEAVKISAITHGHPSGYLSGGLLASIIADLSIGIDLKTSIDSGLKLLKKWKNHEEVYQLIIKATDIHRRYVNKEISHLEIKMLGEGWVAEEALAISILCSLHYRNDFKKAVSMAINHSGDSDSTGAITGNLVGLIAGESKIPKEWKDNLLYKDFLEEIGNDLHIGCKSSTYGMDEEWWLKYPGY